MNGYLPDQVSAYLLNRGAGPEKGSGSCSTAWVNRKPCSLEPDDEALFPRCNARIKRLKDTALRTRREVEGCDTVNTSSVMTARCKDAEAAHLLPGAVEGDGVKLQFSGSEKLMWFNHQLMYNNHHWRWLCCINCFPQKSE